jgi:hypothetical protein
VRDHARSRLLRARRFTVVLSALQPANQEDPAMNWATSKAAAELLTGPNADRSAYIANGEQNEALTAHPVQGSKLLSNGTVFWIVR